MKKSIEEWLALYDEANGDNSGLDVLELRDLLRKENSNIADSQIAEMFVEMDGPEGDKVITREEFENGLNKLTKFIEDLQKLFTENDKDGKGSLDREELTAVLESSGHSFTEEEVTTILTNADTSGNGQISWEEFLDACT